MSVSRSCILHVEIGYFLSLGLYKLRIPFCSACLLKMDCSLQSFVGRGGKKQHIDHPMGSCGTMSGAFAVNSSLSVPDLVYVQ